MNSQIEFQTQVRRASHLAGFLAVLLLLLARGVTLRAELPAPDNLIYGSITLSSQPVTAAQTNVVVEVRRTPNGPAIAHYRMGSSPPAGSRYILKIPLEELAPVTTAATTSLKGDSLFLVVRDQSGPLVQVPYQIPERGYAVRVDFGSAASDRDNDGLPDGWELGYFGNIDQGASGDPDGDGRSNSQEFIAGTNPNDPNDVFRLNIALSGTNKLVQFTTRKAEGVGYEGWDRIYALEYTTNLAAGLWLGVPGRTNIVGDNSTVTYQTRQPGSETFYRTKLSLQAP